MSLTWDVPSCQPGLIFPQWSYSFLGTGMESPSGSRNTRGREHWPQDKLQKGFKTMELFRGAMRVNAGDKTQAYVTLKGLAADIFVRVSLDLQLVLTLPLQLDYQLKCCPCSLQLCNITDCICFSDVLCSTYSISKTAGSSMSWPSVLNVGFHKAGAGSLRADLIDVSPLGTCKNTAF